jgi:hypothetical protein
MSTYGNQNFNNPPYGTPAWHEQQRRLKNAHKSPDPVLAQQQIAAAQPPALSAANPLPATAIPPGSQVNPRQGPAPWQSFKDSAAGVLEQLNSVPNDRPSQYGPQPPVEAAPSHTTGPGILARPQPERYVPAPVEENRGMDPMTPEESAAFRLTPAGQRIYGSVPGGEMGDQTGGRRDSTALAAAKKTQHVSFGEAMGRYGGAIMNAGSQGGMAQVGAMGTVTGEIEDIEREQENLRLQEQQKVQEAQQKKSAEFDGIISEYDTAIAQMDTLYGDVAAGGGSLTGPISGTLGAWWDTLQGNPEAYTRLAMDQFKVDEILKNVAKTKGAISDSEMKTFERPMPSMMADEKVWLDWIYEKRKAAVSVRKKLRAMQGGGSPSNYSPKDQALIDQYSQ